MKPIDVYSKSPNRVTFDPGALHNSGANTERSFEGTSMPPAWIEYQRRATQPLVTSLEFERAIAACEAELAARKRAKVKRSALSMCEWNYCAVMVVIMLLVAIVGSLWIGSRVVNAAQPILNNHVAAIARESGE